MTCVIRLITLVTSDFDGIQVCPKISLKCIQKIIVGNGQITHNFFDFLKFYADFAFFAFIASRIQDLLCYFGTAILEIIESDTQLLLKPASSSSIFCQHVTHTTLWCKHISNVKQNHELYCQGLVSFADLPVCFCQC